MDKTSSKITTVLVDYALGEASVEDVMASLLEETLFYMTKDDIASVCERLGVELTSDEFSEVADAITSRFEHLDEVVESAVHFMLKRRQKGAKSNTRRVTLYGWPESQLCSVCVNKCEPMLSNSEVLCNIGEEENNGTYCPSFISEEDEEIDSGEKTYWSVIEEERRCSTQDS